MMLRKPTCADCPHNLQYMERLPIKKKGVTMHLGERFCVAGKRARKFKRSDPKTYVPSWCPRLKAPCELRIYGFKHQREWRAKTQYCRNKNYNSVNYTTKMLLEDWDQGHCRFWASIPEEGNDNEK